MTQSTDGEISFGILFPEGYEFPWGNDKYEGDIREWWLDVNDYEPLFRLYNEQGGFPNGERPASKRINAYYAHEREFEKLHPLPIELVNVCSNNHPIFIVALAGIGDRASRGYPECFNPSDLNVTDEDIAAIVEFCKTYLQSDEMGPLLIPQWYLSSYWGS